MNVTLLNFMGNDLTVVNAARVSFHKRSIKFNENDEKLIKYLSEHNHWSPFAHCQVSFHIKAPIFVARQLVKHTVGLTWNEMSRRYVTNDIEFYYPDHDQWRKSHPDKKQGSYENEFVENVNNDYIRLMGQQCLTLYNYLIDIGVCAEQSRMILPLNLMTEWYWTGSLMAFARVCKLRCESDAQLETKFICDKISNEMNKLFPVSWKYLIK